MPIPNNNHIEWKKEYEFGIYSIDTQHRKLVKWINQLVECQQNRKEDELLECFHQTLDGLLDYTQYHFSFEEKYFDLYEFSKSEEHIAEHRDFFETISGLNIEILEADTDIELKSLKLIAYLKKWLLEHIQGSDREYLDLFLEHSVK